MNKWPCFSREEADAVSNVLLSNKVNYWTGDECRKFEKEFAKWVGCSHSIALGNGTLALDVALKAIDVSTGDQVITTPRTFIATVSSIVNAGGIPVFADVDLNSQNITAETIEPLVTENTKAVIVVHLAGMPAEMDAIIALSEKYGFYVIEDCAQAHGAMYKGQSVGTIGHIGAWSFCQDKIMTTGGEGGMVTTNDHELWSFMWSYKDHGKSYDAIYNRDHGSGFRWLHESFGTNWRMTEMQAAIGRIQLRKMKFWKERRRFAANKIDNAIAELNVVRSIKIPEYIEHAEYKHYLFIRQNYLKKGWTRDVLIDEIVKAGIPAYQGSCSEVYLEKSFDNTDWRPKESLKNAIELGETSIMFLVHPTLTDDQIERMCYVISMVFASAQR